MKKILLIVNTTVLFFLFSVFFTPVKIAAQSPTVIPTITPGFSDPLSTLQKLLEILYSFGDLEPFPSSSPPPISPFPSISVIPSLSVTPPSGSPPAPPSGLVYYPQCSGPYDNYALPSGCTLCQAGCGPTTVAMMLASYVNKNINPPVVVDLYKKNGYLLGCAGSRYTDARTALNSFGLKTTDYLTYSAQTIDQVAVDFRNYIKTGWTIFTLANYCDGGCGHYFWIIDVDNNNNAWSYDPYYGRRQAPPINENKYYPFPRYRVAFGVRK